MLIPSNVTVSPRGGILLCEEGGRLFGDEEGERPISLTPEGETFVFAKNTSTCLIQAVQRSLISSWDDRWPRRAGLSAPLPG